MNTTIQCDQCKQEAERAFCESHYEQMLDFEQREGKIATLKEVDDLLVLAECEEPQEGKNSRKKFYHLSEEEYKKLFM